MKENKLRICHSISVRALQDFFCVASIPMHERKTNSVFPSYCSKRASDRENKWQGFLDAPSPSVFPSLPPSLPDLSADGECHIRCFPFLHIKPEVTAALFLNQPQMCRHSYLTTRADGTLSEAGSEKH